MKMKDFLKNLEQLLDELKRVANCEEMALDNNCEYCPVRKQCLEVEKKINYLKENYYWIVRYRNKIYVIQVDPILKRQIEEILESGITETEMENIAEMLSKRSRRLLEIPYDKFFDFTEPEDEQFKDSRIWE